MTLNAASLYLDIIPVERLVPTYNQDQLFLAVEQEYYLIRDQVLTAIAELPDEIAAEIPIYTMASVDSEFDFFPLNKAGLSSLPASAEDPAVFTAMFASYDSSPTALGFGLPDGFGSRFGLYQWPWADSVIAAGTGQSIPILEDFLKKNLQLPQIDIISPTFSKEWKDISDKADLAIRQKDYLLSQSRSILTNSTAIVNALKNWNINAAPAAVIATVTSVLNSMNLNPLKGMSFLTNAFRGTSDASILSSSSFVNTLYAEKLFGSDKYITPFAAANIIPMDYNDLRINQAKGNIREMALANELNGGTALRDMSAEDLSALVFDNYSIDKHITNRMEGINAGEEPLPNTRAIVERIDPIIEPNLGFNGEYTPRDIERGVGGKEGKSDYSPLANGITADGTSIEKIEVRAKTGIIGATGVEIAEPKPAYNTQYPENIVFEKNGIVIEIDGTPGSERIHIHHPSHTYIQIDNEGNLTIRNAKDRFEFVDKDLYEYVRGENHKVVDSVSTEKAKTKYVNANMIYLNCNNS